MHLWKTQTNCHLRSWLPIWGDPHSHPWSHQNLSTSLNMMSHCKNQPKNSPLTRKELPHLTSAFPAIGLTLLHDLQPPFQAQSVAGTPKLSSKWKLVPKLHANPLQVEVTQSNQYQLLCYSNLTRSWLLLPQSDQFNIGWRKNKLLCSSIYTADASFNNSH